jgi:hypothetical protein
MVGWETDNEAWSYGVRPGGSDTGAGGKPYTAKRRSLMASKSWTPPPTRLVV